MYREQVRPGTGREAGPGHVQMPREAWTPGAASEAILQIHNQ